MITLQQALQQGGERLKEAGIDTADLDASVLLCHAAAVERLTLITEPTLELTTEQEQAYSALLERRATREPVAYLLGYKEFWSHKFHVEPGVLIPRPDTETLIATLLALLPAEGVEGYIGEIGVGSGAVLLTLLKEYPKLNGFGVDINPKAIEVTARNAREIKVAERLTLLKGEWAHPLPEKMNIIVSNPPYIAENERETLQKDVRDFEPEEALFAGEDGLDGYRALIPSAYDKLIGGGLLLLEVGHTQAAAVTQLLKAEKWAEHKTFNDLAGRPRVVAAVKAR